MQLEMFPQDGLFGKMSQEPSQVTTVTTLRQSSKKWLTSGVIMSNGIAWTRSSSESPNGVDGCSSSLASILQSSVEVEKRYYLSAKAAEGILRRATRRDKKLPSRLEEALQQVAQLSE